MGRGAVQEGEGYIDGEGEGEVCTGDMNMLSSSKAVHDRPRNGE